MDISSDGKTLYLSGFTGPRPGALGAYDIWQIPILPVVDLNGNGRVDNGDLLRLIESWGQSDPSVDIAPPPFGDGTIFAINI